MKAFRLGVVCPGPSDGTSWYRVAGPLAHLAKTMPLDVKFLSGEPTWSTLAFFDAVLIQRGHLPDAVRWAREVKGMHLPLWLDYDDDLFQIPWEHPRFSDFDVTRPQLLEVLGLADVVTVSTDALAESYRAHSRAQNLVVIPNAIDETFIEPADGARIYNRNLLAWRGGYTHREDLEIAKELFTQEAVNVHYYGHMPPWFRPGHDLFSQWMDCHMYQHQLQLSPASTMVVPLRETPHNLSKSNISWLEATWAGMATVHGTGVDNHSQLPEFQRPGVLTIQQWLDGADLKAAREESLTYIRENLTLAVTNVARKSVIEGLCAS